MSDGDSRGLLERQFLLANCLGQLFRYAGERGYQLTLGEGYVLNPRRGRNGSFYDDGVHMPYSLHYSRLAQDLNLFIRGEYITDGQNLAWIDLGHYWQSLDPLCAWGGTFQDANHLSVRFQGKA